ncbi:MAG: N-acetylmuramoyl-L-alanine amidase, partial [Pseudomonadota bacterium]|nr:N-acetylmuramoyl-L-alanine amidase [Pseudomonadota bacterium]
FYEKEATLQMSRELKRLIDQQPGMKAVLTRDKDVFIPLHKRVSIAKKHHADIFISVHADAFHDRSVRGGSVYVLSNGGASSVMARLLAKSENASLQDIKLKNHDNDVAFALSDMSRDANIRASKKLAKDVLKEMQKTVKMHKHRVQSANFAVLKSIDMPSMLVETAFISNPKEAKKLINKRFQTKMASSIVRGLQRFVDRNGQKPRWGETLYVQYKVQSGDTLSQIAKNYRVSTQVLKKLNGIKNANQLYVGKKIRIPLTEQVVAGL